MEVTKDTYLPTFREEKWTFNEMQHYKINRIKTIRFYADKETRTAFWDNCLSKRAIEFYGGFYGLDCV